MRSVGELSAIDLELTHTGSGERGTDARMLCVLRCRERQTVGRESAIITILHSNVNYYYLIILITEIEFGNIWHKLSLLSVCDPQIRVNHYA